MAKKKIVKEESNNNDSKLFAFIATFLSIVGFLIVLLTRKEDKYAMFYAKQSLVVFIAALIVGIINWIVTWIPILGWIIKTTLSIVILVLWIMSWIYALSGKQKEVPIIGHYARNINL